MSRFTGKTALVTGSSNGIGRATAVLFAKEGAKVTITGRNAQRLEETRQKILKAGVPEDHVLSIVCDLNTEEGQDELINSTIQRFGKLDILVNNAGAAFNDDQYKTGIEQDISVYDKVMQINMRSVVTLTQKAEKYLIEAKGEIINVSSMAAGPQGYCRFIESHKECLPSGKVGQPNDIANIIAFLADRSVSSYIIGQTIAADGGSTLVMGMQAHDMMDILKS
ncbi:hypothetical protein CAEBREN_06008 [Caenorhabditis brenneri]|uniref:Uncharacterized protein n=1 Tax=Caenorhabditis brenneri TaxID=135651 RepID=G0MT46_CAEBE|nr:hypothetical protein CAEBREN_06008 [Caenorhabditis brenneri]